MPPRIPIRNPPLAHQVLEILMERIKEGSYPPLSQLPPENEFASEFNVSRATIRSAMSILVARGLITRKQGVGTFVRQLSRLSNPLNQAIDLNDLIEISGCKPGVRWLSATIELPDAELANILQISTEATVLCSHKIFTADDEPVIYCVNSIPTWVFDHKLAQDAVEHPEITEPLFEFLENRCNQKVDYHIAKIRPEISQNCDIPIIEIDPLEPILVIEETGFNEEERPVWHSFEYFPGGLMAFELIRWRDPIR